MLEINGIIPQKTCLSCQGCCRFSGADTIWVPHLLKEEKKLFFRKRKLKIVPAKQGPGFKCAFLNITDNKCRVYLNRPFECRLYPFLIKGKGKKVFLAVDLNCPFARDNFGSEEFKTYSAYLAGFLNTNRFRRIRQENPRIAQDYPGVRQLMELA